MEIKDDATFHSIDIGEMVEMDFHLPHTQFSLLNEYQERIELLRRLADGDDSDLFHRTVLRFNSDKDLMLAAVKQNGDALLCALSLIHI